MGQRSEIAPSSSTFAAIDHRALVIADERLLQLLPLVEPERVVVVPKVFPASEDLRRGRPGPPLPEFCRVLPVHRHVPDVHPEPEVVQHLLELLALRVTFARCPRNAQLKCVASLLRVCFCSYQRARRQR